MGNIRIVSKVERATCSSLYGMRRIAPRIVSVPASVGWEEMACKEHPSLEITEKVEDKVTLYTATLKFYTCQEFDDRDDYAYRVTLVSGRKLLVGTADRPIPQMTVQENAPEKVTDEQLNAVTITYTSPKMIPTIAN